MKPRIIITNKEVFHNLCLLKHFDSVEINNNKRNIATMNKILKNINRNTRFIDMIKNKNKLILNKRKSSLDYHIYLK